MAETVAIRYAAVAAKDQQSIKRSIFNNFRNFENHILVRHLSSIFIKVCIPLGSYIDDMFMWSVLLGKTHKNPVS
jgi:hypothetical protein